MHCARRVVKKNQKKFLTDHFLSSPVQCTCRITVRYHFMTFWLLYTKYVSERRRWQKGRRNCSRSVPHERTCIVKITIEFNATLLLIYQQRKVILVYFFYLCHIWWTHLIQPLCCEYSRDFSDSYITPSLQQSSRKFFTLLSNEPKWFSRNQDFFYLQEE